ncbi:hypothetical protein [Burkholderia singularis]|nr:hypothetical protein [Burkholderia singularis]
MIIFRPRLRHISADKLDPGYPAGGHTRIRYRSYRSELPVLSSAPMSYWRNFFIVVLLALSLPVQSFAAASMKCASVLAKAGETPIVHAEQRMSEHHHDMPATALAADDHHARHHGGSHHAHSCSTCAACCFGTGLPAVPAVVISSDATRVVVSIAPGAGVVSFLTDGIERPPRYALV